MKFNASSLKPGQRARVQNARGVIVEMMVDVVDDGSDSRFRLRLLSLENSVTFIIVRRNEVLLKEGTPLWFSDDGIYIADKGTKIISIEDTWMRRYPSLAKFLKFKLGVPVKNYWSKIQILAATVFAPLFGCPSRSSQLACALF